jgi:hypothetical protein
MCIVNVVGYARSVEPFLQALIQSLNIRTMATIRASFSILPDCCLKERLPNPSEDSRPNLLKTKEVQERYFGVY